MARIKGFNPSNLEGINDGSPVKGRNALHSSFRRKPESSNFSDFWILDQVRDDGRGTFYGFINDYAVPIQKGRMPDEQRGTLAATVPEF